jgi:hypothetical protein
MGPGRPGRPGGSGKNGGQFMGRHEKMMEAMKEPKPESIKEVPGYLYRLITKFFHRLFYIFRLVWDTKPWILLYMVFMAIFNGVTPVIGAKIGADLLNALGYEIAAAHGLNYLCSDFKKRNGFKESIALSEQYELYRQDYCGCEFSRREREEKESF